MRVEINNKMKGKPGVGQESENHSTGKTDGKASEPLAETIIAVENKIADDKMDSAPDGQKATKASPLTKGDQEEAIKEAVEETDVETSEPNWDQDQDISIIDEAKPTDAVDAPADQADDVQLGPSDYADNIGEWLKLKRQERNLTLDDISSRTRVSVRHLQSIENSAWHDLPGRTYTLGFVRGYLRSMAEPEDQVVEIVRQQYALHIGTNNMHSSQMQMAQLDEVGRSPQPRLIITALIVGLFLVATIFGVWRTFYYSDTSEEIAQIEPAQQIAIEQSEAATQQTGDAAAAINAESPVVFTALEDKIWVKFYDGNGSQLFQKQMDKGESYTVPEGVDNPQIWTARPEALAITIGGKEVPKLSDTQQTLKDIPISAESLLARNESSDG